MTSPSARTFAPWLAWLGCLGAVAAAMAYLWFGWCVFPAPDWNEVRLAPAFALRHGLSVYAPIGGGPLSTWIYGPLPIAVNLPATFAPSAAAAIEAAGAITVLTLVAPLALVCWTAEILRGKSAAYRGWALALCVLLVPTSSLIYQVADHVAVACGIVSCWCLARRSTAAAAGWCVLAICSKQTAVFLVLAQVIYLLVERERRTALQYLGWSAGFGAVAASLCGAAFGFGPLWLNLVEIPARLPWGDPLSKIALRWPQLAAYVFAPMLGLLLWRRSRFWPERTSEFGRMARCNTIAFFALLPLGLTSFLKIGGDINVLHSWYYVMPLLVAGFVGQAGVSAAFRQKLMLATLTVVALRLPELRDLPSRPLIRHLETAAEITRAAPGTIWFPSNPVVTFYSDGRLYHVEDGLATRHLAGLGIREADFRRHLPPALATVVYPANVTSPFALQLLPEYKLAARVDYWAMYRKDGAVPP